jgi:hypothetical protein
LLASHFATCLLPLLACAPGCLLDSLIPASGFPVPSPNSEHRVGTKKTGKGRRKLGRKKRRMRSKIRHRKK